ncbi:MAG: nicotinate (nicotinamide) nucleotide adenylyltransferase [Planctomycetes bacterium]|nr:nicotinate (nicotinamide) nucleotide adenylyltransferase [Planctomycetota bacterium]
MKHAQETTPPRRVGLFGGSFDPVHAGHLHAARAALAAFRLDRVVFVPAAVSPHKVGVRLASAAHRTAMLRLAIADEPRFDVSEIEIERGGRSYTIDTVRDLPARIGAARECELFLIIGSDNLALLPTWREAEELLARVQPIIVHRAGEPAVVLDAIEARFGSGVAEKLRAGYLQLPPVVVSSTDLRARLPRGVPPGTDLPAAVAEYIRVNGLYTSGS